MKKNDVVDYLVKVEEITKVGLKYSTDLYARDNYVELETLTKDFLSQQCDISLNTPNFFKRDIYPTPNVSVRSVVLSEDKKQILLVQERCDEGWSLPGGWSELTLSPSASALKELREEAGLECEIVRLVGALDRYQGIPTTGIPEYILVFEAKPLKELGELCHEIIQKKYFPIDDLPKWSIKNNPQQMLTIINAVINNQTLFD